ncbi:hypothetical protein J1N35_025153 [Gossypium stocksii]|uniref:RNase H type-1 domain-containing protein n=1 Tax=Gossypium stocksii TaxID=47602 RepID=A0A9D3ZVX8_9ROSI|nr:hypothetical protein J1N35_025153 [Gossypium stocksii]
MSFLMKIGFNLVSNSNALWVCVLRSRYGWKEQILGTINKSQCSHLWQFLSKIWLLLRENLDWAIGDGASARYWKDSWILDVINRIINIRPPHPDLGSDNVIWARSTSGAFSIRSAFWTLKEDTWSSREESWENIWKYQGYVDASAPKSSKVKARQFESFFSGYKNNIPSLNPINIFDNTWVLLSTNGVMVRETSYAATRGVVRDNDGNWIMGFSRYLGVYSLFEAEVWVILDEVLILLNK